MSEHDQGGKNRPKNPLGAARPAPKAPQPLGATETPSAYRRRLNDSSFSDDSGEGLRTALGITDPPPAASTNPPPASAPLPQAAAQLTVRDQWRAIQAPIQGDETSRTPERYLEIIEQFAVETNPRYAPDGPDKPRAHIFVWDVTRAMNVEVPHFVGARELTLSQTYDWIRHEGPLRGWFKTDLQNALRSADRGLPVLVLTKPPSPRLIGFALPGGAGPGGKPFIAAAANKNGARLSCEEALGTVAVEYYFHA